MANAEFNLSELVEKMPPTDRELEAIKAAAATEGTSAGPKPKADKAPASKFTAPDPEVAEDICRQILQQGRRAIEGLIELIRDPASPAFVNYKPEYLCHCLTVFLGHPTRTGQRRAYVDILAAQAGRAQHSLHTRLFLIRELQWIGDTSCVAALAPMLLDERLCDAAACALLAIRDGVEEAFRKALATATGRCRLVNLQSLAVLSDRASARAFEQALEDADADVRMAAGWGLARLPHPPAAAILLRKADAAANWERIKLTQSCLLMAERLVDIGRKAEARTIYTHLRDTRQDPGEKHVREAARKALELMGTGLAVNR